MSWVKKAKCRGLTGEAAADFHSFVPERIERAKAICATCPVKLECRVAMGQSNLVAGGTTKLERLQSSWHRIEEFGESSFS